MAGKTASDEDDVLGDVFASDRDRGADSAAPEPEAAAPEVKPASADATPNDSAAADDSSKQYRDPETGRFVPLHELKTERSKRQEEARLREEAERRASQYERELAELQRAARAHMAQQQQQPPPDWLTEPDQAAAHFQNQIRSEIYTTRVLLSQETMRSLKPDYDEAEAAFAKAAETDPSLQQKLFSHPNPAKFAYEQGKRVMAMSRIGDDVDGYEKRIREEERQRVLAELKQGKSAPQRFPGTLADATASGGQGAMLSDEAMMADVFGSDRRTRKR